MTPVWQISNDVSSHISTFISGWKSLCTYCPSISKCVADPNPSTGYLPSEIILLREILGYRYLKLKVTCNLRFFNLYKINDGTGTVIPVITVCIGSVDFI
jgi:hypothetical protein